MFRYLRELYNQKKIRYAATSYSQCGEDLIINHVFKSLKITKPRYLDIGAHHPVYLSNTYLFYKMGGSGVCIEPDPDLFKKFKFIRKRDVLLNIGVGVSEETADFYIMTTRTLNTFSKEEAFRYQSYGNQKIEEIIKIPLMPVDNILKQYFKKPPNLISLDVEGMDSEILQSMDFSVFRPEVLCVETLTYTENNSERKIEEIIGLMRKNGYMAYGDTYINTVFVDEEKWLSR